MGMEGRNGVVEVERDSVDVPGANASSPETLELVRRLPVRTKGWVWVRVSQWMETLSKEENVFGCFVRYKRGRKGGKIPPNVVCLGERG